MAGEAEKLDSCYECGEDTEFSCQECGEILCKGFLCSYKYPDFDMDHVCAMCFEKLDRENRSEQNE